MRRALGVSETALGLFSAGSRAGGSSYQLLLLAACVCVGGVSQGGVCTCGAYTCALSCWRGVPRALAGEQTPVALNWISPWGS